MTLLYPTIPPYIGYSLLVLCAALYALAGWLWWSDPAHDRTSFLRTWSPFGPQRQIPFNTVRDIATLYGIKFERFGVGQNTGANVEGALKAAAANGRLKVWGRPYQGPVRDHDPMLLIPAEHFHEYSFRHGALDYEVGNDQTYTATMAMVVGGLQGIKGMTFYDLHVSERQVRAALARFAQERRA